MIFWIVLSGVSNGNADLFPSVISIHLQVSLVLCKSSMCNKKKTYLQDFHSAIKIQKDFEVGKNINYKCFSFGHGNYKAA